MARPTRTTDDPPKRTPSFVCEVSLQVTPAQERMLLARLEAARRRVRLVRESKALQHARTLPRDDPARKTGFRQARTVGGLSD